MYISNMEKIEDSYEGITVIVPAFNAENTIGNCIRSICRQTYKNLQIICVNDGSKDNTLDIIEKLQKEDDRIQIINQSNGGAAAARNNGILHAVKKYIAFVDADDEIDPVMYETMLSFMQENQLECVCCDFIDRTYDGKENYISTSLQETVIKSREGVLTYIVKPVLGFNDYPKELLKSMVNKLFLRSVISENNILVDENKIHGEDREFCLNYYQYISSFGFVRKPFYHYIHWNRESLSAKVRMNFLESILESQNKFRNWYPELDWTCQRIVLETLSLPLKTALYYRENLNADQARCKLDSVYGLCVGNVYWLEAAEKSDVWQPLMQDKSKFDAYIWKKTTRQTLLAKTKKMLKIILRKN